MEVKSEKLELTESAREIASRFVRESNNRRAVAAVRLMLENGSVTTAEMAALGYDHPPRALMDAKDAGVPFVMQMIRSEDGKRMARYTLTDDAKRANSTGRQTIPKWIKAALLERDGSFDRLTGIPALPASLTVDHRIPFQIGGDSGLREGDLHAFMLLELTSQRKKSWACEHCPNFIELRRPDICASCFWALPESYEHVATRPERREEVVWQGTEVSEHELLRLSAERDGLSVPDYLKQLAREQLASKAEG